MKIKYNETDKSIEINDNLRTQYILLKLAMMLNLINAVLNLYDANKTGVGFFEVFWLLAGITSLVVLFLFIFRRSTLERISINKIQGLKEKSVLGRKRFTLELNDGKKRNLTGPKTQEEINEMKRLFTEIGISN